MIHVNVKTLRGALKSIKAVVETKVTMPILTHVLVRSTPGQMVLTGTDLVVMIDQTVDLEDAGANKAMTFCVDAGTLQRSEEHTSELQSLMRISYAVFCLKKKTKYKLHNQ